MAGNRTYRVSMQYIMDLLQGTNPTNYQITVNKLPTTAVLVSVREDRTTNPLTLMLEFFDNSFTAGHKIVEAESNNGAISHPKI